MQFLSIYFLFFLLVTLVGYYCVPNKYKHVFIFAVNILFYLTWITDVKYLFSLISVIIITYFGPLWMHKVDKKKRKKILCCGILIIVGALVYFKYTPFLVENWNELLKLTRSSFTKVHVDIIMPLGVSFYTFQALSYYIDVYKEKIPVEKNFILYASYVSFFPTITSGPIERPQNLLYQLKKGENFSKINIKSGLVIFLWGAFVKLVISDRLAVLVNTVFADYKIYGGMILLLVAFAYALQIYCDFSSYSLMAVGIGKLFGLNIVENFNVPYFSQTIQEFWRRWHISLSTWFRDYVYIPLGGNRCSIGRKNLNLFLTFLVSGIWHGANWTFIVWGAIHGIYQIVGNLTKEFRNKFYNYLNINKSCFSFKFGRCAVTFVLVTFAWIFFRAPSFGEAIGYIQRIFISPQPWELFDLSIYELGLSVLQMNILVMALLLLFFIDYLKYKYNKNIDQLLVTQNIWFQYLFIVGLFFFVFVFGMYGPAYNAQEFIYFQF